MYSLEAKPTKYPLSYTAIAIISCLLCTNAENHMSSTESCMQKVVSLTGKKTQTKASHSIN